MLAEKDCPREHRFLFTDVRFGSAAISYWKEVCREKQAERLFKHTALTQTYLDWEVSENELALFTNYAYADVKVPKSFSCLFDLKNPERVVKADLILKQAIFEAWYPIDQLDHGHKHLCIFQFQDQIPSLIYEIEKLEQGVLAQVPIGISVGICQWEDYSYIKKSLLKEPP